MFKKLGFLYLTALVLNLVVCWSIALIIDPQMDEQLTSDAVADQLEFVFGDDIQWLDNEQYPLQGKVKHGALFRKAHIAGWSREVNPVYYAEEVLKVGWPFTTVRGFAHTVGDEVAYINAIELNASSSAQRTKFFPLQLVWPGLIINSLLLAIVMWCVGAGYKRASS